MKILTICISALVLLIAVTALSQSKDRFELTGIKTEVFGIRRPAASATNSLSMHRSALWKTNAARKQTNFTVRLRHIPSDTIHVSKMGRVFQVESNSYRLVDVNLGPGECTVYDLTTKTNIVVKRAQATRSETHPN